MDSRRFGLADRLIGEIDKIIKVLTVPARAARALPEPPCGAGATAELCAGERLASARLMRVNHAGEVAAQALYQGQALTARHSAVQQAMRESAAEEIDHLAWCEQRLHELNGRTSVLNPLWYFGSLALGAFAGALGDRASLSFITETEKQVESHLSDHLERLSPKDSRSRAILEEMRRDEAEHGAKAASLGGSPLPQPVALAMKVTSLAMTHGSYWL
jgi:ubiquinone biosynthesis monooxygenase Coq7